MTQAHKLKLYTAKICPWAQRATLALHEVGANYEHVEIDLANKPSWYTSMNPASKVPVLQLDNDDNTSIKIPESNVIMELVADLYPGQLLPQDPIKRAEARYFVERFNQVISTPFYSVILRGEESAAKCLMYGVKEIQDLLNKNKGDFALGDKVTLADIGVWPFVARIMALGKAGMLVGDMYERLSNEDEYKVWRDYHSKLQLRPAHKATFDEDYVVSGMRKRVEAAKSSNSTNGK
ncbi:hypothetical protein OIO90_002347 [Microbotryomycetes sp. JL221]|nr:hypothetical protein OIO90_002347 [Microbotryomycetes sp. JL221]